MGAVQEPVRLTITLNGTPAETDAQTVSELVEQQQLAAVRIATAVNGHFVPQTKRATTALKNGDRVEIVSPRQGG